MVNILELIGIFLGCLMFMDQDKILIKNFLECDEFWLSVAFLRKSGVCFCGQCGDEIDQITYINGDVCYSCEEGE